MPRIVHQNKINPHKYTGPWPKTPNKNTTLQVASQQYTAVHLKHDRIKAAISQ